MSSTSNDPHSTDPVGGGAESVPDPISPVTERPDRSPADADELGGPDTVESNDQLDGNVQR